MTGDCKCPDPLTCLIYLCRCPKELQAPLLGSPWYFRDLLFRVHNHLLILTFGTLPPSLEWTDTEELVSSYFPTIPFPEYTLLHLYMTVARDFAKSARTSIAAGLVLPLNTEHPWVWIEDETVEVLELL